MLYTVYRNVVTNAPGNLTILSRRYDIPFGYWPNTSRFQANCDSYDIGTLFFQPLFRAGTTFHLALRRTRR